MLATSAEALELRLGVADRQAALSVGRLMEAASPDLAWSVSYNAVLDPGYICVGTVSDALQAQLEALPPLGLQVMNRIDPGHRWEGGQPCM